MMYKYYDITPQGKDNEFNCVCRAISLATHIPYNAIEKLLVMVSNYYDCDMLSCSCYTHLLEDVFGFIREPVKANYSVRDICIDFPKNSVLARIKGHLTICIEGVCYDIFDCLDKQITCYWIIE